MGTPNQNWICEQWTEKKDQANEIGVWKTVWKAIFIRIKSRWSIPVNSSQSKVPKRL